MDWSTSYVALDTETTGFGPKARVLEVGVVTFERGVPVREWSQLLCPTGVDWEDGQVKKALEVNQIKREELEGKPTFEEVLPQLLLELSIPVWVAHNLDFDLRMLQQEFARLNQSLPLPHLGACTFRLSAHLNPRAPSNKLADTAAHYGVLQEDAHRATVDARVCGLILAQMHQRGEVPGSGEAFGVLLQRAKQARARH